MTAPAGRRRWWLIPLALVTLLAWLPALLLVIALAASNATGCQVDEAGVHPCLVAGLDIGEALNVFMVSGWFMLVTLPVMAVTAIVWVVLGLYAAIRRLARTGAGRA